MAAIRSDLIGEVWADKDGERVVLRAGDDVPAGVEVESDLVEGGKSTKADDAAPTGYDAQNKPDLEAEIDKRNEGREDDAKIVPEGKGNKPDLIAALEADDAASTE